MNTDIESDSEFLKSHLRQIQRDYATLDQFCTQDVDIPDGHTPESFERCARLADELGFDGNRFRNLFLLTPGDRLDSWLKNYRCQIQMIPRMIAKIGEKSDTGCRLSVEFEPPAATLDNTRHPITGEAAWFLDALIRARGKFVSGKQVAEQHKLFPTDKVTRVRETLPCDIGELVKSKSGAGSRLVKEAWIN